MVKVDTQVLAELEEPTEEETRALLLEARAAGDKEMIAICRQCLRGDAGASLEVRRALDYPKAQD